ncbi:aminotransferase class V-fold PLP-dependent enzyme [Kribbella sp. NPDC026611]|uniref:aminotransferase class V-fold PLP-dependent enzyme n=1 Tax=Kribbella sp. NPDC026611 TaxID=3154911 RepID=UPI0033DE64E7
MASLEPWRGRGRYYLNTAAYGLPPRGAIEAADAWIRQWSEGSTPYPDWLAATDRTRALFADLVHVPAEAVATGTSVSQLVGLVAASLPSGTLVIADEQEFASLLLPFLAAESRGVRVELVPRHRLADAIAERGDLVLFSLVSSADGTPANYREIQAAAASRSAWTVVDAAQACGWLELDYGLFDLVVCPAFKWLGSPRGVAFLTVRPDLLDALQPIAAGWWPAGRGYGGPLELGSTAKRLDVSPVWNSWVAAEAALGTIGRLGVQRIGDHVLALANRFRAGRGLPVGPTPIVVVEGVEALARLTAAGFAVTHAAGGGARLSFGPCNDDIDVDKALEVLG